LCLPGVGIAEVDRHGGNSSLLGHVAAGDLFNLEVAQELGHEVGDGLETAAFRVELERIDHAGGGQPAGEQLGECVEALFDFHREVGIDETAGQLGRHEADAGFRVVADGEKVGDGEPGGEAQNGSGEKELPVVLAEPTEVPHVRDFSDRGDVGRAQSGLGGVHSYSRLLRLLPKPTANSPRPTRKNVCASGVSVPIALRKNWS